MTDFRDSLIGTGLGETGSLASLVSQSHSLQQLLLPHQGDVDAVGRGHCDKRNKSLDELRGGFSQSGLQTNGRPQRGESGREVGRDQLVCVGGCAGIPIGVVDQGVEGLVEPLPEDDLGGGPVPLQHGPRDQHPARHLERHPTKHVLQLPGVRVECGLVELGGSDDLTTNTRNQDLNFVPTC